MLKKLRSAPKEGVDWCEDRRSSERFPTSMWVRCLPLGETNQTIWKALVRDVSTLGIGLITPQSLEMRSLLEIDLENARGLAVRRILARVVHIEEDSSREWLVGCAFVSELQAEEMALFHADAVKPGATDHRRWLRFPCNVETVCYTSQTAPGECHPARILNISPGGIGLLLSCDFPEGTLLNFEIPANLNQPARPILVRVVRAIEHGKGYWILGCEFADQLAEDELRMLLRG